MHIDQVEEQTRHVMLPLKDITRRLAVRRLNATGILRLKESMQRSGFLDNFPLIVALFADGTTLLIDGNHRLEAALALKLVSVPCVIKTHLTEHECYALALQSNRATETVVPSTFVTYAEFIWSRMNEKYKQQDIADMLGWSREKVAQYAALKGIDPPAWEMIVTTFEPCVTPGEEMGVTPLVTNVTFSEGLLRSILPLTPEQQRELVQDMLSSFLSPGKFKERAANYRARNEMKAYALQQLGEVGEPFHTHLSEEIEKGSYDKDWREQQDHPKLQKLIGALRDQWERKHSMHLIRGNFYEEVRHIGDGCIDLILTDPPYNIARENVFTLEGRSTLSQDFGAWDKHGEGEFVASFTIWAREWKRLLRSQGSGYVFTSDRYISHLREALEGANLHVKATIIWHKTNPGTQIVHTNFKSSVEYLLFFTKGEGGHTFNWQGENDMHNFIETAICGGNERLVDSKGSTLHPTQKPEQLIRHFLDISSNRGDTIFDGFAGVGTTGKVAKDQGRKFIGIEQDLAYFEAMQRRLAE
jgi:DNA modification methylase